MARAGIAVIAVAFLAAGCGGSVRGQSSTIRYSLREVKAAFATQGVQLQRMRSGSRDLIVLYDPTRTGAFGYQRIGSEQAPGGAQFLVFVGNGPHGTESGNVFVTYGEGESATVKTALRQLERNTSS